MRVFVNFRPEITDAAVVDRFRSLFLASSVFDEVVLSPVGQPAAADYGPRAVAAVARCDAFLAIIRPGWLAVRGAQGCLIDNPLDPVRAEITAALNRILPMVPVLMDGATFPDPSEIAPDLQALVMREPVELRLPTLEREFPRLLAALVPGLSDADVKQFKATPPRQVKRKTDKTDSPAARSDVGDDTSNGRGRRLWGWRSKSPSPSVDVDPPPKPPESPRLAAAAPELPAATAAPVRAPRLVSSPGMDETPPVLGGAPKPPVPPSSEPPRARLAVADVPPAAPSIRAVSGVPQVPPTPVSASPPAASVPQSDRIAESGQMPPRSEVIAVPTAAEAPAMPASIQAAPSTEAVPRAARPAPDPSASIPPDPTPGFGVPATVETPPPAAPTVASRQAAPTSDPAPSAVVSIVEPRQPPRPVAPSAPTPSSIPSIHSSPPVVPPIAAEPAPAPVRASQPPPAQRRAPSEASRVAAASDMPRPQPTSGESGSAHRLAETAPVVAPVAESPRERRAHRTWKRRADRTILRVVGRGRRGLAWVAGSLRRALARAIARPAKPAAMLDPGGTTRQVTAQNGPSQIVSGALLLGLVVLAVVAGWLFIDFIRSQLASWRTLFAWHF